MYFDTHNNGFDLDMHEHDLPQTVPPTPQQVLPDTSDAPLCRSSQDRRPNPKYNNFHMFATISDLESLTNTTTFTTDCIADDLMVAVCHYLMMH